MSEEKETLVPAAESEKTADVVDTSLLDDCKSTRLKSIVALVIAITSAITALSALTKPRDDRATQQSYEAVTAAIKELNEENQRQHDDLLSLRVYLDGYVRGNVQSAAFVGAGAAQPDAGAVKVAKVIPVPVQAKDAGLPVLVSDMVMVVPDPPVLNRRPKTVATPSFRTLQLSVDSM